MRLFIHKQLKKDVKEYDYHLPYFEKLLLFHTHSLLRVMIFFIWKFCRGFKRIINKIFPEPVKEIAPIRARTSSNDEEIAVAVLMAHLN